MGLPVIVIADRQPLGQQQRLDLAAKGGIADRGTIGRDVGKHRALHAILQAGHGKHSLIFLFAGHQRPSAGDYGLRVLHLSCKRASCHRPSQRAGVLDGHETDSAHAAKQARTLSVSEGYARKIANPAG